MAGDELDGRVRGVDRPGPRLDEGLRGGCCRSHRGILRCWSLFACANTSTNMLVYASISSRRGRICAVARTDTVEWLSEGELRVWRALVVATGSLMASLDAELQAEHGLSLAEYEVLVGLSE